MSEGSDGSVTTGGGGSQGPARKARAYLAVVAAGALFGTSGPFSVALFRMDVPARSVAVLRLLVGILSLGAAAVLMARPSLRVDRRGLLLMLGPGAAFTALFHLSYQLSTEAVGVPSTVALLYLAPALVVLASGPVLGEWPSGLRVLLAAVSVVGVWMTVLGAQGVDFQLDSTGLLWGVLTGVGFAGYTVFARAVAPRYGALVTLLYSSAGATAILAVVYPILGWDVRIPGTALAWATVILFGLTTVTLGTLLFFTALRSIQASRAAIGATVEPLVAALLAMWLLDQGLTLAGWVGLLVLVGGVVGAYAVKSAEG